MSLRFHEIAETNHRILNPFTEAQLMQLGTICRLRPGMRQLDLCCGKAEMLCRWAAHFGIEGAGVDISSVFLDAASARASELGVAQQVHVTQADASTYPIAPNAFDVVSCIGATWIGNGLVGTIEKMRVGLRAADSFLLVGEPFWIDEPPEAAYAAVSGGDRAAYTTLAGTLERIEHTGCTLVEMILATHSGWDRYVAMQWMAIDDWLRAHPAHPDAAALRAWNDQGRRAYMEYGRRYFGWGVFVIRQG